MVTLPRSKSRRSSNEATARTDLISFGGTMTPSSAGVAAASAAALTDGRAEVRFTAGVLVAGFSGISGCTAGSVDAEGCAAFSVPSVADLSGELVDGAFFAAALGEVTGRSLINFVLPFSPSVPAVVWPPGSVAVFAFPGFETAPPDDFLAVNVHGIQCL